MKLSEKEKKLLAFMYHCKREPLTKIAKSTRLTRSQVEYGLRKFSKKKIIEKFVPMINYASLGFNSYVLLLIKLEKYSSLQNFLKFLEKSKNCVSCGECFGKYEIYANLIFRNDDEINDFLSELLGDQEEPVLDYSVIKPYLTEFYPMKLFRGKQDLIFPLVSSKSKKIKLDKLDGNILKILARNSRIKIIDIANELGVSAEVVLHRIRRLYRTKILFGSRSIVKMKELGYNYSMILMSIKNLSREMKNKIIEFSRKEKRVNVLVLSLFNPNCLIQVFHKTNDELKEEIKAIKKVLEHEIVEMDVLLAQEEKNVDTLPFLTK